MTIRAIVRVAPLAIAALQLACSTSIVCAQDFSLNGLADTRLVQPSSQRSWMDGGLGKLRFDGGPDRGPEVRFDEIAVDGKVQFNPDLAILGTLRYEPRQHTALDILEGYVRYRPVSTADWQWTNKAGAFYPPISLENESVAWTSPWTLTPSAINTWVGEELRTIGAESALEWRYDTGAIQALGALYGWNGAAGTLLTDRGWALGDRPTGLLDNLRQPDSLAARQRQPLPWERDPWVQIGSSPGWYGGVAWRGDDIGRVMILHYDNEADPTAFRSGEVGWRTKFNSAGAEIDVGDFVVLTQAMIGTTEIDPSPTFHSLTKFRSAYVLVGRVFGDWTVAARAEAFDTHEEHAVVTSPELSEHGHAGTFAVSWRPRRWLRLTGEALHVDSYRLDRINEGLSPRAVENQYQFSVRLFF